jgi:hypothetical protein
MAHPAIAGTPHRHVRHGGLVSRRRGDDGTRADVVPGYAGGPLAAPPLEAAISCRQTAGVLASAVRVRAA